MPEAPLLPDELDDLVDATITDPLLRQNTAAVLRKILKSQNASFLNRLLDGASGGNPPDYAALVAALNGKQAKVRGRVLNEYATDVPSENLANLELILDYLFTHAAAASSPDLTPRVTQLEADTLALRTPGPNAATLYVQGDGSTLTAQRGNPYRPYPSLPAAHAAAQSGDTILVRPGGTGRDEAGRAYYAEEYVQTKNVFVTFEPGAIYGGLFWLGATNGPGFNYRVVGGEFRERILLRRQQVASTGLVENARFTGPLGGVQYASSGGTPTSHTDTLTLRNCVIANTARTNPGTGFGYELNGPVRNNGFVGGGPGDIILDNTLVITANTACLTDSAASGHVILRGTTELRPGPGQGETSALQAPGMPAPRPASEWLVDERATASGPARDPYDVPTAKALQVIADYKTAGGPLVESDESYYGCVINDDYTQPGDEFKYECTPSRPAAAGGATVWKWRRYLETGV